MTRDHRHRFHLQRGGGSHRLHERSYHGEKVGMVKVHLYRPSGPISCWLPSATCRLAVLDRTKGPAPRASLSMGDVVTALAQRQPLQ